MEKKNAKLTQAEAALKKMQVKANVKLGPLPYIAAMSNKIVVKLQH